MTMYLPGGLVSAQAYHPLFVWFTVHLQWRYQFLKLASLKAIFRMLKTNKNKIKTLKITAMLFNFVFLCLFWWFVARESSIFKIAVGLAQK